MASTNLLSIPRFMSFQTEDSGHINKMERLTKNDMSANWYLRCSSYKIYTVFAWKKSWIGYQKRPFLNSQWKTEKACIFFLSCFTYRYLPIREEWGTAHVGLVLQTHASEKLTVSGRDQWVRSTEVRLRSVYLVLLCFGNERWNIRGEKFNLI